MDIKEDSETQSDDKHYFNVVIKEEPELVIDGDCQWKPIKLEDENEYYQEYFQECKQKDRSVLESYTIKFLDGDDEHEDFNDHDSDYYVEGEEDEYENSSCDEDIDSLKEFFKDIDSSNVSEKQESAHSEVPNQLNSWLAATFVEYECPECTERFLKYALLSLHLQQNHEETIDETEKNYFVGSDNCGVCKKCSKEFNTISFRYFHTMKHNRNYAKLEFSICKICNFKAKGFSMQKHILEEHSEVLKQYKKPSPSKKIEMKCPLCTYNCKSLKQMWYHFLEKHPQEYSAKTIFTCHLCIQEVFNDETLFLQHLIENHKLDCWQILNYRKVLVNEEYVACTECGSLFFQNDTKKILKHFLKHESNSYWTCKFCSKNSSFTKTPHRHMCLKLIEYYNICNSEKNIDNTLTEQEEKGWHIKNLQGFEKFVAHICPFCNRVFNKMLKWQQHLNEIHEIETLKGLEMKEIIDDNNKLCCVICHALVVNFPEKLHAHRFQHLPFKPYKCLLCHCALSTFKIAVDHLSKNCKKEDDKSFLKDVWIRKVDDSISDIRSFMEIQCSLCNNKKFIDVRSCYNHYQDAHNNFKDLFVENSSNSVTCKVCYKSLVCSKKRPFFLHIIKHFDDKTFQCKICFQSFANLKGINEHFLCHPSTRPLYNQTYRKNDQRNDSLHMKKDNKLATNVTSLAVSSIKSHVLNEFAEFIAFVCPECNEDMDSQPKWHTHIATKHTFFNDSVMYFKADDGSLKCTTCKIKLPSSTMQQQKHKLTHMPYKSFMCNLCYKRCNTLGVLYGHFRRKHFAVGEFACPLCSLILQTSYQRTKHIKDNHPRKEWPETMCLICYTIMSTNSALRVHMRIHDADRVKHTCETCGAKIVDLKDFNLHVERHKRRGEIKTKISPCVLDNENKRNRDEKYADRKLEGNKAQIIYSDNNRDPDLLPAKKIKNEPAEI